MNGTIADYGEQEILKLLQGFCPPDLIGDDGAVLGLESLAVGSQLVITTDVLVDGVHFSEATTPAAAVGWRAMAANLSDLAAMGADPLGITVGLALPPTCPLAWVLDLYGGMLRCFSHIPEGELFRGIVGGDLCRSSVPTIAITAFGVTAPGYILHRGGLPAGDQLVVTGCHGASRAGLAVLLGEIPRELGVTPAIDPTAIQTAIQTWIRAHQYPKPRLDVLPVLRSLQDPLNPQRSLGGMDSSDGLADAVLQLCRASGVGAWLDWDHLPLPPGLVEGVGEAKAVEWCLYGGEDFELVLGLPPDGVAEFLERVPGACWIGEVIEEPTVTLRDSQFPERSQLLCLESGFQHFR
jgi:thiamine-monophosphate kinase